MSFLSRQYQLYSPSSPGSILLSYTFCSWRSLAAPCFIPQLLAGGRPGSIAPGHARPILDRCEDFQGACGNVDHFSWLLLDQTRHSPGRLAGSNTSPIPACGRNYLLFRTPARAPSSSFKPSFIFPATIRLVPVDINARPSAISSPEALCRADLTLANLECFLRLAQLPEDIPLAHQAVG